MFEEICKTIALTSQSEAESNYATPRGEISPQKMHSRKTSEKSIILQYDHPYDAISPGDSVN